MTGWIVAAVLFVLLVVLGAICRRFTKQLQQARTDKAHLTNRLAAIQKELNDEKSRGKKSFAVSTEALIVVERDFTISSANKVARRLFGKPAKGTTLMTWTRQHRLQELIQQTMQGKKMPPLYFDFGNRSLVARTRFIKENKQVVAVALAVNDVTELQHLSRARRDFVANISHELRTPLASIQLLTETLINSKLEDKSMALKLIDKIATQTEVLGQLAQELLDLSMIESGQAPLRMTSYLLKDIANAQVERLLPQARRKGIEFDINIPDNISVLVDETMIGRVLGNLIHNAIKFTENGRIIISAHKNNHHHHHSETGEDAEEETVTIEIADTGIGIPTDEIRRIFERFYIVDRARNRKKSGTGLGLAIAKHIVEAHGGHIWAKSEFGSGATFCFTLLAEDKPLLK